jgi:cyclopropane-fatty-acyl-phospholipid synthase
METISRNFSAGAVVTGNALDRAAQRLVLDAIRRLAHGSLLVEWPGGRWEQHGHPGASAALVIHDPAFFRRTLLGGEIGLGESYMAGEWSSPNLVRLVELMLANRDVLGALPALVSWPARLRDAASHLSRRNSRTGSRRNISAHYDLSNEFFALFLDDSLMYSCAVYPTPAATLEEAQRAKLAAICDQLAIGPTDHVLEIGTGWGGFAEYAAAHRGCRVSTTTISRAQHDYARGRFARAGLDGRIELRLDDYRDLRGRFDKIVSIEMFEAVGLDHYDEFFAACERLLAPAGSMLLQTITVDDWRFDDYRRTPSWIAKHVFPGSELASVARILASLGRVSTLSLASITHLGPHYALTLGEWRRRFLSRLDAVRALGFDQRFIRMWDLYLAYCQAAFAAGHIGNAQLVLGKPGARRRWMTEPT